MDIASDMYEGTTIKLASGFGIRLPKIANAPNIVAQDVKNVATGLLELIGDLDKRLAALEKSAK